MIAGADAAIEAVKAWPAIQRVRQPTSLPARNLRHRDKPPEHVRRVGEIAGSDDFARYSFLQGANTSRPFRLKMRGAAARLRQRSLSPGLYVLNYHEICSDEDAAAYRAAGVRSIFTTAQRFREHLEYFWRNFSCVPLPQGLAIWRSGDAVDAPVVTITFDDGLRSLHPHLDEMTRANLAPALFLCGDPLIRGIPLHNHRTLLAACPRQQPYIGATSATEWLKWGRVSAIGSHTWSHKSLADISPEAQREEVLGAQIAIGKTLGTGLAYFAYPFGHLKARAVVSEYFAHEAAPEVFNCNGGINRDPNSVGTVLRIGIHNETVAELDGLLRLQWVR
jgi:peptidoglycan/xylan/chitin deacetylase (PgdA/CDA1 family)